MQIEARRVSTLTSREAALISLEKFRECCETLAVGMANNDRRLTEVGFDRIRGHLAKNRTDIADVLSGRQAICEELYLWLSDRKALPTPPARGYSIVGEQADQTGNNFHEEFFSLLECCGVNTHARMHDFKDGTYVIELKSSAFTRR